MAEAQSDNAKPVHDYGLQLVVPGRRESPGDAWTWIVQGWKLFLGAPLIWIVGFVLMFVVTFAVGIIPIVGSIAMPVLQTVMMAGFMVGCRSLETEGELEIEHLFAGFSRAFAPLAIVGLLLFAASLVIGIIVAVIVIAPMALFFGATAADPDAILGSIAGSAGLALLGVLLFLGLLLPVIAAYWFAPALVALNGMKPMEALKESFFACFRNFVPFIVYSLILFVLLIVAMIPLGLGILVLGPVAIASTYVAYRRIFTEEPAAAPAKPAMVD